MAAVAWQPSEQGVAEISRLLEQYLQPGANQAGILQELQRCSQIPDFGNYLAYILCNAQGQAVQVRQGAGLLLKNHLKEAYGATTPSGQQYVKSEVLRSIGLDNRHLRGTVGTLISTIVELAGLPSWPELLQGIAQCLDSNDFDHTEGALDALYKMCEDNPAQVDADIPGLSERPITVFLPRLLQLFQSPHASFRRLALGSVNHFLVLMPQVLMLNMDSYLRGVFALALDPSPDVRQLACSALVQMVEMRGEYLAPHLRAVVEYMVRASGDSDSSVALEACEFWTAFCQSRQPPEVLREFLPQLVGTLLSNMEYADDDEALLEAEDDSSAPDSDQDLKPRFHTSKFHGAAGDASQQDGEEEEDDEETTVWNLRKCSASALDTLSNSFGDEMLPILLPLIKGRVEEMQPERWREREAAILALGAISDGCIGGLLPVLTQIVAILLPCLDDAKPLIRSISCWTLSRYSRWLAMACESPEGQAQFDAVLAGFLARILDPNKNVQEAACSAFATLEEEAVELLPDRLDPILQHLSAAFGRYQRRNMRILYDAMGTLADCVGPELQNPRYVEMIMPPLIGKWQQLSDTDKDLFPLLECLTSISQALGPAFTPFAEPIVKRCSNLIQLQLTAQVDPTQAGTQYEKDFVVCSLDLLSGMCEGLGPNMAPMVAATNLRDLVVQCCTSDSVDVRQSAFALVGDLAKSSPQQLQPRLADILTHCTAQLSEADAFQTEKLSVSNNACWAVGEVAMKLRSEVAPVVLPVMSALAPLLSVDKIQGKHRRALTENCAITLGRLAWACPDLVAPHMGHFLQPWAQCLRTVRDDIEKEDAFQGLCAALRLNPMAATNCLTDVALAISSWRVIHREELRYELRDLLHAYKKILMDSGSWPQFVQSLDSATASKLTAEYGL